MPNVSVNIAQTAAWTSREQIFCLESFQAHQPVSNFIGLLASSRRPRVEGPPRLGDHVKRLTPFSHFSFGIVCLCSINEGASHFCGRTGMTRWARKRRHAQGGGRINAGELWQPAELLCLLAARMLAFFFFFLLIWQSCSEFLCSLRLGGTQNNGSG